MRAAVSAPNRPWRSPGARLRPRSQGGNSRSNSAQRVIRQTFLFPSHLPRVPSSGRRCNTDGFPRSSSRACCSGSSGSAVSPVRSSPRSRCGGPGEVDGEIRPTTISQNRAVTSRTLGRFSSAPQGCLLSRRRPSAVSKQPPGRKAGDGRECDRGCHANRARPRRCCGNVT
jgi:hypothetical protein